MSFAGDRFSRKSSPFETLSPIPDFSYFESSLPNELHRPHKKEQHCLFAMINKYTILFYFWYGASGDLSTGTRLMKYVRFASTFHDRSIKHTLNNSWRCLWNFSIFQFDACGTTKAGTRDREYLSGVSRSMLQQAYRL